MLLTIWNFTRHPIPCHLAPKTTTLDSFSIPNLRKQNTPTTPPSEFLVEPRNDFSTTLPKGCFKNITLISHGGPAKLASEGRKSAQVGLQIKLSIGVAQSWKVISVPEGSPWKLYLVKLSRNHRKLMIFPHRNTTSFLSSMPDRLPLSSLLLPATHDTMAFYGWPISQCQTSALTAQLRDGIRVLDIRLAVIPPPIKGAAPPFVRQNLIAYHGVYPEKTPFLSILTDVHDFLTSEAGRGETIVMSIKQEDAWRTPPPFFSQKVREFIMNGPGGWDDNDDVASRSSVNRGMWFLENRIPKLGEVRGKVILFSRFGGDGAAWPHGLEGLGIHPTTWPDSCRNGFEWDLKGTRITTRDWYAIPSVASIPEKVQQAATNLIPPRNSTQPVLPISFFSGSSFPLALPPTVAKGVAGVEGANSLLGKWLLSQIGGIVPLDASTTSAIEETKLTSSKRNLLLDGFVADSSLQSAIDYRKGASQPRIRGWVFLDYYAEPSGIEVVPLLVECNFLGRTPGEEGW